jgi:hypothetical protein
MAEPTAFALSKLFSDLVGAKVAFSQASAPIDAKIKQIYGVYTVFPNETAIVVKADLPLLGSLAGGLVGVPDNIVKEKLKAIPEDELLRDAIHEVMNIASAVITVEGRAVLKKVVMESVYCDGAAAKLLVKPDRKSYFNVTVAGYQGGRFNILAQM